MLVLVLKIFLQTLVRAYLCRAPSLLELDIHFVVVDEAVDDVIVDFNDNGGLRGTLILRSKDNVIISKRMIWESVPESG